MQTKIPIRPAKLISSTSHQVPGKLTVTELFFEVPLDHADPDGSEKLRIFCRSAERFEKPAAPKCKKPKTKQQLDGKAEDDGDGDKDQLPLFVYVQGGPGFGCPPPQDFGITGEILSRGYKFITFDHRGMGLSTTATAETIKAKGSPSDQLNYLQHFRADTAVRDLEAIRLCLTAGYPEEKKKWSVMGQSYGGYVSTTYLSSYPEGLREVFTLGGLPPVTLTTGDEPIRRCFKRVAHRNEEYYGKFPEDVDRVRTLVQFIEKKKPVLLSGVALTVGRFLQMGIMFGFHGGFDIVHDVVLRANNDLEMFGFLTRPTLSACEGFPDFDNHVLYALMHGPLYVNGDKSNWVFDRVFKEFGAFAHKTSTEDKGKQYFTGEMVFKAAFDENHELQGIKEVAELLEQKTDWPPLYDPEQLRKNEVPIYAAIYVEDMYVDYGFSSETARIINGCKTFVTNVLYHNAVRARAAEVMKGLFDLRDDSID
ncbi:uncharacterized protein A1O9_11327 [Exophiala aquamarina CBS 119918]|uniref:AB hydrolase-1 domain-containing protein n=1 Tax=Exophiala aquamarina CBS 119918 TaxID=1182545 RepID=A0A072PA80_9EURO|nr:uncharacterized protein A1O9_11327 [Exophiala aquamarina CBS 119918]KEF52485.1 hypothetical protein A1O9_11327 [Exophiala aquamarina CBS 119918]